jgi:signal transduction histidine kinase
MSRDDDEDGTPQDGEGALLLDDFAAMAIHELGGPILAMSLHVELMQTRIAGLADSKEKAGLQDLVQKQRQVVAELRGTLTTLMRATRVGAGREGLERRELDLVPLARGIVERASPDLVAAGCDVRVVVPEHVMGAWDAGHVEIVVKNLLSNAAKHARGKPVAVTVDADDDVARVTVEDGGPGIPAADRARVFERYRRLSSASGTQGLGLGLWIANVLVQAHGGAITVDESPLGGASFTVALPKR